MKKTILATIAALTFAGAAAATEVSVQVADLSADAVTVAMEDVVVPVQGVDIDISTTQGDVDSLTVGADYKHATKIAGFAPYASVDYTLTDEAVDHDFTDAEVGAEYAVGAATLDASYKHELSGRSLSQAQASVAYKIDEQMTGEFETVYDFDTDRAASNTMKATYDFTPAVYAEASYEFEADTAGLKVGYKF